MILTCICADQLRVLCLFNASAVFALLLFILGGGIGCLVFVSLSSAWIANTWQVQMLHYGRVINSPSCHSWLAALQLLGTHGSSRYGAKGRAPHSATLPSFIRIEIRQWHSRHQWTRCQTPILTRLQLSTESRLFDTGLGGQLRCVSCSEQHGTSAFIRLFAL
ncbi:hypothetical protein EDD16DRAFT_1547903 [Pisolithus croceorrhizus]|nr:hypothetical protein EDD16DRAFT_1547903 [Pisolithus croceorrhizus]